MQPFAPIHHKPQTSKKENLTRHTTSGSSLSSERVQVIGTRDHVILQKGQECLWCSKENGAMIPLEGVGKEVSSLPKLEGKVYGLIGKLRFFEDSDWHLLLIDEVRRVGSLPPTGGMVYCIERVSLLPLSLTKSPVELDIESYVLDKREKELKERDKLERRLKEALLHMFNGSQSFYFSPDIDLTQSTQRQHDCGEADKLRRTERIDDRFFWNKHMIAELLDKGPEAEPWITPVIQGFIEIMKVPIPSGEHLGVFKKYTPKKRKGLDNSSLSSSTSTVLDMRSFMFVEKQGDELISRSYSSDIDNPSSINQHDPTSTENGENLNTDDDQPFRERSVVVSSPTQTADISSHPEYVLNEASSQDFDETGSSPHKPSHMPDLPSDSSGQENPVHVHVQPHRLLSDHNQSYFVPIKDSWADTKLSAPDSSPIFRHLVADGGDNPTTSTPSAGVPSIKLPDDSPTKSRKSRDIDSIASCDTDEWMDGQLEDEFLEQEEKEPQEKEVEEEEEGQMDQVRKKWVEECAKGPELSEEGLPLITMALISRRSRHRAGTRYLRRGVDEDGHVANYVETEMVVIVDSHIISFMIVRGSVPVFWTQSGNKYRPDPVIQRSDGETSKAFENHFEQQINLYDEQVLVSLINRTGRERTVGTAYERHLLMLDCPSLTYVAFDFHHHCKVNQWHNINLLLDSIEEYINRQNYFWYDLSYNKDVLCHQKGVFRINCVDCLDRTNVVQSVICREVLQTALQKLGLLLPFESISGPFLKSYQELWANNGDTISKQYTGTAAMKGDLTRHGQRKLYGVMKDGYNSAQRFILSLFRDAYRQAVIDLQQGVSPSEALLVLPDTKKGLSGAVADDGVPVIGRRSVLSDIPSWSTEREETIAEIVKMCIKELYPYNPTIPVKGWLLLEPQGFSFIKGSKKEEETVLLLCSERGHICVANYNAEFDHISCCIRIPLERIERITIGQVGTILRSSPRLHMRIHYSLFPGKSCHFTFRTVHSMSLEEDKLNLLSIAQDMVSLRPQIPLQEQRLSRKRSPPHEGIVYLIAPGEWMPGGDKNLDVARISSPSLGEGSNRSSPLGSDMNISYVPLNSNESTPQHIAHSRQSSFASSMIRLGNEDTNQSGYESDSSSHDEMEMSFSVPSSPHLSRRTSVLSLEERSRLLSHSSISDLTVLSEEGERQGDRNMTASRLSRDRSFAFSADDAFSSDSEDSDTYHQNRMNSVLSISRRSHILPMLVQGSGAVDKMSVPRLENKSDALMDNTPTNNSVEFGDLMTFDEIRLHTCSTRSQPEDTTNEVFSSHRDVLKNPKVHSLKYGFAGQKGEISKPTVSTLQALPSNKPRFHSESAPLQPLAQSNVSADDKGGGASVGGKFSRLKGRLLNKVRSATADNKGALSTESEVPTSQYLLPVNRLSKHNSLPGVGKGKNKEGRKDGVDEREREEEADAEEEWLREAIKSSKTRFIII